MTTFVVLPGAPADLVDQLRATGAEVQVIEAAAATEGSLAARVCAAINVAAPSAPLAIAAAGPAAMLLPAVALAQRSAHRRVVAYLLVEPEVPAVSDGWPDAPVAVLSGDDWATTQARLRGWDLLDRDQLDVRLHSLLATGQF